MELRGSAQERERLLQECALLPRREGASEREREREIGSRVFVICVLSGGMRSAFMLPPLAQ